jgi:predicted metal-dependent TIM-barrel fold hydrolase
LKIFDAQIRSDVCSEADLQNLHYFETERVVITAHSPRKFERAEDLLGYFDDLATEECARLKRAGLQAHVALGVLPGARPRRAHFEVWRELPYLLEQPEVVAVGEIGAWEDTDAHWELFERQIKIARDAGPTPVIATPPTDLRVNMTYKMMQRVQKVDMPSDLVLMNRLDERLVETVIREGFVAGVSVGSPNLEPRKAAHLLVDLVDRLGSAERIVLNSSLRTGGADVLGIPKTIVAMQDMGMSRRTIERIAYGNAMALFVRQVRHLG